MKITSLINLQRNIPLLFRIFARWTWATTDLYVFLTWKFINLTLYEKQAILTTHTANTSFNSFAAEVVYHAKLTKEYDNEIINYIYEHLIDKHALRADMGVGEEKVSGYTDYEYYNPESDTMKLEIQFHGEY